MQCAMCKLSSKLRGNENNSDILIYQLYLLKLHENVLKYYRLDLFEEITIGDLQMTSESPSRFSGGFLI